MQFLQINLHHSKAASAALLTRLATGNIDVVLIPEPWIVGNNICGSESSWNLYHTKLSLYKKEIRIAKRRAWANFCSSIESTAEASRLRRILAKAPATIGYLKTNADSWTENSQETLELMLDTHFPKNTHVVEDLHIEESLDDQSIDNISNPGRIQWTVNSFKPFKSPGPDGFFPAQLQRTLYMSALL